MRERLRDELPNAAVTMVAVLASFFAALAIKNAAGLDDATMVLAVALALTNARLRQGEGRYERLRAVIIFPIVAVIATEVGRLMWQTPWLGDTLFVLALSAGIWVRRFGGVWPRVGTLIALPFIAILVAPGAGATGPAGHRTLWTLVIAACVVVIVNLVQLAAQELGVVHPASPPAPPRRSKRATADHPASNRAAILSDPRRWAASSRMALQMAVGLAAAFAIGHVLWPEHWTWVVLTAYIVASGNRGRGDVLHKSGLRVGGAAAGAVAATLIGSLFSAGNDWAIVVIFCILGIAVWLRQLSYAYWAAAVTAMLSLFYAYLGVQGEHLVVERVAGIVVGAVIAVTCAWFITPVKTTDVLRRRLADALAALSDWLTAARTHDLDGVAAQRRRLDDAVTLLQQLSPTLAMHRRLARHPLAQPVVPSRGGRRHDLIDGLVSCRAAADAITDAALSTPRLLDDPALGETLARWQKNVGAARRSLRRSPPPAPPGSSTPPSGPPAGDRPAPDHPADAHSSPRSASST